MQWGLPGRLQEISALALTAEGRLLAVDDERAIVYELDFRRGGLVKAFALGNPVLREDFEGLAAANGKVYLMTSEGDIYEADEGADGQRVNYARYRTGVDSECEFEGLAEDVSGNRLLLLCKGLKRAASIDALSIFVWDLDTRRIDRTRTMTLPGEEIVKALRMRRVHPSGLVVDERSGHLLVVAAREQALIELGADGRMIAARRFPLASRHPQAEGIAVAEAAIVVADEGGSGKARLSVYQADRPAPGYDDPPPKGDRP